MNCRAAVVVAIWVLCLCGLANTALAAGLFGMNTGQPAVLLKGPWDVYLNQHASTQLVREVQPDGVMHLPGYLSHPPEGARLEPFAHGVATLHLRMARETLPFSQGTPLAISIDRVFSAGRVLVVSLDKEGKPQATSFRAGAIGEGGQNVRPLYRPGVIPIMGTGDIDVFIEMANHSIPWLGIEVVPKLGRLSALSSERKRSVAQSFLVAGLLLLIGIYHLFLYGIRRTHKASLYFAAFSLLVVVRVVIMSRLWATLFPESDGFSFLLRSELATGSLIGCFLILFFMEVISDWVNPKLARLLLGLLAIHSIAVWVMPLSIAYGQGLKVQQWLALVTITVLVISLIRALRGKPTQALRTLVLGIVALALCVVNDVLHTAGVIESFHAIPFGVAALAICQGLVLALLNARDRSRAEILSVQLNQRNQELRRISALKDQFLANTSHELRTPLNGIIGLSEAIQDGLVGPLNEPVARSVRIISKSGRRLAMLVNDILDFSKLKKGEVALNLECVDVHDSLMLVQELSRGLAEESGVMIAQNVPADDYFVLADGNRFEQIILNLVQCSLRFTRGGTLSFSCEEQEDSVALHIHDSGGALPDELVESLYQDYEATPLNMGPDGLGLSVSRSLVALHAGQLEATVSESKGTLFSLKFPRATDAGLQRQRVLTRVSARPAAELTRASDLEAAHSSSRVLETPEKSGRKILVIHDEEVNGYILRQMLEFEGHEVLVVDSGESGVDALALASFDLVLLDLMLPGISGYEVLESIRASFDLHQLPVLILTARGFVEDLARSFTLGANDYLAKPFTRAEVLARVAHHLKMTRYSDEMMGVYGRLANEVTERELLSAAWEDVETVRESLEKTTARLGSEEQLLRDEMSRLEELILQADKMTSLGQMVAGLSHDIAHPLGYVVLSSGELMRELMVLKSSSGDSENSVSVFLGVADMVEGIDHRARQLGRISEAMRNYTRLDSSPVVGVEVESLVSDCLFILGHRLEGCGVRLRCEPGLIITCYRSHLGQVIANLISNALEAVRGKDGGRMEIGSRRLPRQGEDGVEIWVGDSGDGVAAALVPHIFELFFTTRSDSGGSGVGLGLCAMVAHEHGGDIEVGVSQELGGAEFRVWVPVLPQNDSLSLGQVYEAH